LFVNVYFATGPLNKVKKKRKGAETNTLKDETSYLLYKEAGRSATRLFTPLSRKKAGKILAAAARIVLLLVAGAACCCLLL